MAKKETKTSTTKKSSKEKQVNEIPAPNQVSDAVVVTPEDAKAAIEDVSTEIPREDIEGTIETNIEEIESTSMTVKDIENELMESQENFEMASKEEDNILKAAEQAMEEAKACEEKIKKVEKNNYNFTNFWNGQCIY